jgi:DNA-binding GntR family transcriptional regulator
MDRQDIEDLFELREVLESYAAGRAARCMDEEGLRSLRETLRELRELALRVRRQKLTRFEGLLAHRWVENDVAFHLQIVRAAGNRSLRKAVEDLRMISRVFGRQRFLPEETPLAQLAWTYRHHSRIASAIARRDAQAAARFAADHAARARVNALVRFDWQQRREQDAGDHGVWPASVTKRIRRAERRQTSRRRPARPRRSRP